VNAPTKATNDQLTQFDWGHNRTGWEFVIDNQTPFDLVPVYGDNSHIDRADSPIKAGATGYAKGIKSALPPFIYDGPADADLGYRFGSTSARIFIKGAADGTISRRVEQDPNQRMSLYFPDTPGNQPQIMVFQWIDLWGPNYDGWEWELTNDSGHELEYWSLPGDNVESCPARLPSGAKGRVKGKRSIQGGPANCNFTYRRPDALLDLGGVAISADRDATRVHVVGSKNGTIDIDYAANPPANVVQTVRYKPQG
jgi:hypothetical protein